MMPPERFPPDDPRKWEGGEVLVSVGDLQH